VPRLFIVAMGDGGCQAATALKRQGDKPTGAKGHFDGWQLGLLSLCIAGLALALAVPRQAEPAELPVPKIDPVSVADILGDQTERAQRVRETPLPFEVRAVGEALRGFSSASFTLDEDPVAAGGVLARAAARALQLHGKEALLDLRAIQTELFLTALKRWEGRRWNESAPAGAELTELAGNFVEKAKLNGWVDDTGRLVMSMTERIVLFRVRWGVLTGLSSMFPFKPSLTEWRIYYRFLLEHPEAPPGASTAARAARQLAYASALGKLDRDFPMELANGILLFQSMRYPEAMRAFQAHLTQHPTGPYTLRARNFWLSSASRSPSLFE